jgi:hypothetical protein
VYGGLWAADGAQRSEANEPGHDEIDGDEVIKEAWENQDKNPYDKRYEG